MLIPQISAAISGNNGLQVDDGVDSAQELSTTRNWIDLCRPKACSRQLSTPCLEGQGNIDKDVEKIAGWN